MFLRETGSVQHQHRIRIETCKIGIQQLEGIKHNAADNHSAVWEIFKNHFQSIKHFNYSFLGCIKQMFPLSSYCLWMLSNLILSPLLPPSLLFSLLLSSDAPPSVLQYQSEGSRPHLSKLDLEQWYQELMAGSSQLCPPLPTKCVSGRRPVLQVQGLSSSSSLFPLILLLSVCAAAPLPTLNLFQQPDVCVREKKISCLYIRKEKGKTSCPPWSISKTAGSPLLWDEDREKLSLGIERDNLRQDTAACWSVCSDWNFTLCFGYYKRSLLMWVRLACSRNPLTSDST